MDTRFISLNGTLVDANQAVLSVSDLAIQRGYGIFDFLKTIDGKPVFMNDHIDRFFHSAEIMGLAVGLERTAIFKNVNALMTKNNFANSGIKIILTGGDSADGYTPSIPNLLIIQTPFAVNPSAFEKGTRLVTYNHQRQLPDVKTIDYLQAIRLRGFIADNEADDVLYHHNEQVCECPRANFFIVTNDQIITPKSNILHGITRKKLLTFQIAGYEIIADDFTIDRIKDAHEAFVCSSTKNILPVLKVDGQPIGSGTVGSVTRQLQEKLLQAISDN